MGRVQGQLWWAQGLTRYSTLYVLKTEENESQPSARRRIKNRTILQLAEEKRK